MSESIATTGYQSELIPATATAASTNDEQMAVDGDSLAAGDLIDAQQEADADDNARLAAADLIGAQDADADDDARLADAATAPTCSAERSTSTKRRHKKIKMTREDLSYTPLSSQIDSIQSSATSAASINSALPGTLYHTTDISSHVASD